MKLKLFLRRLKLCCIGTPLFLILASAAVFCILFDYGVSDGTCPLKKLLQSGGKVDTQKMEYYFGKGAKGLE